jgi:TolA-binding protein
MPVVSLRDLQQQITQRERELQALRQELETRQNQLARLASRKEQLQAQLRQVEADIATLAARSPAQPAAAVPPTPPRPAPAQPRLADLIITLLRHAGQAMTSRQLRDEALRRGYQTSSRNLAKTIEVRIQDLKRQGLVRKASGQAGYVLVPSTPGAKAGTATKTPQPAPAKTKTATAPVARPAKPGAAAKKDSRPSATVSGTAKASGPMGPGPQPPLRDVLTTLLKKSNQQLSARELADQALASGYRTNSANFVKVVGTMLGEMDNVAYLPEQGYRLKKTKGKS